MRAFVQLWDEITRERYGVTDDKARRFRYGVQVNSLGLTEAQPENNIQRIVLEMLGVTLSKNARARAVQLPAWNEALGLPRPWDQQWSLRMQQVLALETDLLEYEDIFDGSLVIEAKVARDRDGGPRGDGPHRGDGRRRRGRRVRLPEERARRLARRPSSTGRVRRRGHRRRQPVHDDRAEPADREPRRGHHAGRSGGRGARDRGARRSGGPHATSGAVEARAGSARRGGADRRQPDGGVAGVRACRRHHGGVGERTARRVRRVPRPDRCHRLGRCRRARRADGAARGRRRHRRRARPPPAHPRRQARPRRPFERRRAGRRRRPRRRASRSSTRASG